MTLPGNDSTPLDSPASQEQASDSGAIRSHGVGLYVLPALIVLVFVGGWMFVFWLLHEDQDPQSLVQGMQQPGRRSWQKAYALSELLLNPRHDHLRDDALLCRALTATLERQNEQAEQTRQAGEPEDEELVRFRAFLCRTLGEFRLLDGLAILLRCAAADTSSLPADSRERDVRRAALEAIAMLAGNVGARQGALTDSETIDVLAAASRETGSSTPGARDSDIASAATFALGVIGGPQATELLVQLLADTRLDVRYNAATGLARQGRSEATSTLVEMLKLENRAAVKNERTESARVRKQLIVLSNGIRATERLLPAVSGLDRQLLLAALQRLEESKTAPDRIRIDAKDALLKLNAQ